MRAEYIGKNDSPRLVALIDAGALAAKYTDMTGNSENDFFLDLIDTMEIKAWYDLNSNRVMNEDSRLFPKRPKMKQYNIGICPSCGAEDGGCSENFHRPFCCNCGQALLWDEE